MNLTGPEPPLDPAPPSPPPVRSAHLSAGTPTVSRARGEIVSALARSWEAIRARHHQVPPVVLAVGSCRPGATMVCLGSFVPIGWSPVHEREPPALQAAREEFATAVATGDLAATLAASAEAVLIQALQLSEDAKLCRSEVFITDDGLCGSATEVLGILLHEAAHAVAERRGVKATSRQGRYHNARFKALAEELGLEVAQRDPLIGWSAINPAGAAARAYTETIADLSRALDADRRERQRGVICAGQVLGCECGRWVRCGRGGFRRLYAAACGVCGGRLE